MSQFREFNDRKSTAPSNNQAFNHIPSANRMQQPWRDVAKLPNDNRGLPPDSQNLASFRNINADLYAQALAAKSSLGLLDPVASPALSALRSYGAARSFSPPTSVTQRQEVSSRTPTLEESLYGNTSQHVNKTGFAKGGFSQENKDSKGGYQIDFKSALDLNLTSVDDEDEFLYGDSSPALPESKPIQPQPPPSNLQISGANLVSSVKPPAPSRWSQNKPVDEYPTSQSKSDLHFQAKLQATTLVKPPPAPIKLERKQLYPTGSALTGKEKAIPVIEKPVEKVKFGAAAAEILKQLRLDKTLKELVPQPQPIEQSFSQRKPAPSAPEVKDTRTSALRVLYDPSENESEIQKKDPVTLPKNFPSTENSVQTMKEYAAPRQENPPKSMKEDQIFFEHPAEKLKMAAQIMDRKNSPIYPNRTGPEFWHSYKDDYSIGRGGPSLLSKSHELKFDDHKHESPNKDYDHKSFREISRSPEKSVNQSRSRSPLYPSERNYRTSRNESPNRHIENERYDMKTSDTGLNYRKASANQVIRDHSSEKSIDIFSQKETSKSSDSDFVQAQLIDYKSISFNKRPLGKYDSTDVIDFDVMRNLDTSIAFTFKNAILDKFTEIYKQKASGSKDGKMGINERSEAKLPATSNVPKQAGQPMQPYKQLPDYLQQSSGSRDSMRRPSSPEPSSTLTHHSSVHSQASKSAPPSREKYGAGSSSSLPMAYPTVQHSSHPPNRMPSGNSVSSEKIAVKTEHRIPTERYENVSDLQAAAQRASQSEAKDSKGKRPISRHDSSSSSSSGSSDDSSDDTESLVKQMEKLINRKNDIDKELMHTCKFVSKMKTEKENYERAVKLSRNVKLADLENMKYFQDQYENANSKFKKLADESKSVRDQIKDIQPKLKSKIQSKPKSKKKKFAEEIQPPPEPTVVFQCFDTGNHWCETCNESFATLAKLMVHLHESSHIKNIDPFKVTKDTDTSQDKKSSNRNYTPHPVKGVEFMKPMYAYYCSLCEITVRNRGFAELHLKGHDHTVKYQNYIRENPLYENKRDLIKTARIQALVKEKRKKELEERQAKRPKIDNSPQNEKAMTHEEYKDKGKEDQSKSKQSSNSKSSEDKYERKHSISPDESKKGSNLPITAPKKNQILIGRAPNFKARPKPTVNKLQNSENKNPSDKTLIAKAIEEIKSSSKIAPSNKNPAEKNYPSPPYQKRSTSSTRDSQADHQKSFQTKDVKNTSMKLPPKEKSLPENKMGPPPLPGNKMGPPPLPGNKMGPPLLPGNKMGPPPLPGNKMGPPPLPGSKMGPPPLPGSKMGPPPLPENKMKPVKSAKEPEPNKNTDAKAGNKKPSKLEAPKTSDPVINQALKYILHGGKSSDQDLSRIKLPEDSPKNPSPKPPPKPKAPMTEEEKDFYMLGINKGDMQPLVVPRPPPSSLLQPLDVIQVPPFPPPLTVPPPLSVPPPNLAIDTSAPPPQMNYFVNNPPPVTGVVSASVYHQTGFPNIRPPAVSLAPPVPTPRTRSSFPRPSTNLIRIPIGDSSAKVVDMEIDDDHGDSASIIIENAPSEKIDSNAEDGKTIQADAIAVSTVENAPSDKIEPNVVEVEKTVQANAITVSMSEKVHSDKIESDVGEVEKTVQVDAIAVSTVENAPSDKIEPNVVEVEKTVQANAIAVSMSENVHSDKIESSVAKVEETIQATTSVSMSEKVPSDKIESDVVEVEKTFQADAIAVSTVENAPSDKIEPNVVEVEKTVQANVNTVSIVENASSDTIESDVGEFEKTVQAEGNTKSTVHVDLIDEPLKSVLNDNSLTGINESQEKGSSSNNSTSVKIPINIIGGTSEEIMNSSDSVKEDNEGEKISASNSSLESTVDCVPESESSIDAQIKPEGTGQDLSITEINTNCEPSGIIEEKESVINDCVGHSEKTGVIQPDALKNVEVILPTSNTETINEDKWEESSLPVDTSIESDISKQSLPELEHYSDENSKTLGKMKLEENDVVSSDLQSFDSTLPESSENLGTPSPTATEEINDNICEERNLSLDTCIELREKVHPELEKCSVESLPKFTEINIDENFETVPTKESVKNDSTDHSQNTDLPQLESSGDSETVPPPTKNLEKMVSNPDFFLQDASDNSTSFNTLFTRFESDVIEKALPASDQCTEERSCMSPEKSNSGENRDIFESLRSDMNVCVDNPEGTCSPQQPSEAEIPTSVTEVANESIHQERNLPSDTCNELELGEKAMPNLTPCSDEKSPCMASPTKDSNENSEDLSDRESVRDSAPQLYSSQIIDAEASCENISDLTMDTHDDHMNSSSELNEPINAEASHESISDVTMDTHDDHMISSSKLIEPIMGKNVTDSDVEMKSIDASDVPEELNRDNENLSSSVQDLLDENRSSALEQTDLQENQPSTNLKTASEMEVDTSIKGLKEQEAKAPADVTIKTEPGLSNSESNLDLANEIAFARALLGSPVVPPVEDSEQNSNSREMLSQTNLNVLLANEQYVGLLQVLREKTRVLLGKEGEKSSSVGVASPRSMTPSPSGSEVFIKVEGSKPEKRESSTKNPSVDPQIPQLKPQSQHIEADDVQVVLSTEKQTSGADVPVIDLADSDSEDDENKDSTIRKNDSDTDEYEAS